MFVKLDFAFFKTVPLTLGYTDPLEGEAVLRYAHESLGLCFLWEMLYISPFWETHVDHAQNCS